MTDDDRRTPPRAEALPNEPTRPPRLACADCGLDFTALPLAPRFCPRCGEETRRTPPPWREAASEFVGRYLRTLALLVGRPGRLTTEFLAGRRRRYVAPLRLFLATSFVFFLAVKLLPAMNPDLSTVQVMSSTAAASRGPASALPASAATPASAAASRVATTHLLELDCLGPGGDTRRCGWLERRLAHSAEAWQHDPARAFGDYRARALSAASYAVFLLLPAFAGIVALVHRGRRRPFHEHVVFSLHMHAFWFIAGLAVTVLPEGLQGAAQLATLAYGLRALQVVHGGRWTGTLARGIAITVVYGLLLVVATAVLATVAFVL